MTILSYIKDAEQQEPSHVAAKNVKWCSHSEKSLAASLKLILLYDPAIPLLGIYSNKIKTFIYTNLYKILIVTLSIITKSTQMAFSRWVNYAIFTQWTTTQPYERMNLKGFVLSDRSQSQKVMYYVIPCIWYSGKGKNHRHGEKISGHQGLGVEGGFDYKGATHGSLGGDELSFVLWWWLH